MGIANTTIAAALCLALFGGDAAGWTGPGTGVVGAALEKKREVVAAAVARHRPEAGDPFDVLRRLGGLEFAAMAGAILAARMGRVPVVLDGFCAGAAATVLYAADPRALDHCVAGHVSAEPGHGCTRASRRQRTGPSGRARKRGGSRRRVRNRAKRTSPKHLRRRSGSPKMIRKRGRDGVAGG